MAVLRPEAWSVPSTGFFDPSRKFVTSHFIFPLVFACIRAALCVYSFTTVIVSYSWLISNTAIIGLKDVNIGLYKIQQSKAAIGQSFDFFTYLAFWSLCFYLFFSSMHTFMFPLKERIWLHDWPKALQLMHSLYYSCVTSMPFLVTIVFWGTMNSGWSAGRSEQRMNLSVHGLNSVFAIVEILQAPLFAHLGAVLLVLSMCLGFTYLKRYIQGFYVYEWMNPAHDNVSIILHVLGYADGMIAIFFLVSGAIRLRNMLKRLNQGKDTSIQEKNMKLDDASDTWSRDVSVCRPPSSRKKDDSMV